MTCDLLIQAPQAAKILGLFMFAGALTLLRQWITKDDVRPPKPFAFRGVRALAGLATGRLGRPGVANPRRRRPVD